MNTKEILNVVSFIVIFHEKFKGYEIKNYFLQNIAIQNCTLHFTTIIFYNP